MYHFLNGFEILKIKKKTNIKPFKR